MAQNEYGLPEYPCKNDVWDELARENRPIVVYGMGNGADKLLRRFDGLGITVSDIFASDGFVRGHSYRGFKVLSFAEIKEKYTDFVIVLSFASNRREVVELFESIDSQYDMYIPDMPIAGEEEYFDRDFYNANYESIKAVYELLADGASKNTYAAVLNYKLTGKLCYLMGAYCEKEEIYSLLSRNHIRIAIDAGAYNGDTAREMLEYLPNIERIYAVEPDRRNFKKLSKFAEESEAEIVAVNAAAWCECQRGSFIGSGNRNSSVSSTASYKHTDSEIELITLDSLGVSRADYIKYDVEGAEYEALVGSDNTVRRDSPALLVSLYHRSRDIFSLPLYVNDKYKDYELYIRRLYSVPAWELDLIALKKE